MYTPETGQAAAQLHQLLVAMMPRRWSSVRLDVRRDDTGQLVHLTNLSADVRQGGGAMPPGIGHDPDELVGSMNGALVTIARDLADGWNGLAARMDRAEDGSATLALLAADGAEQSRLVLSAEVVSGLALSDELFDALDATRAAAHQAQQAFQERIQGFQRWDAAQDTCELSFVLADGTPWVLVGQAIGSWSGDDDSWVWAWGNRTVAPGFAAAVARVRDGATGCRGLGALTTPKLAARRPFAVELALHAAAVMGAQGVFPGPFGNSLVFLAAMP